MSADDSLKEGFLVLFEMHASTLTVFRDFNSPKQRTLELRGMKNNEKKRLDKVMFQFPERVDVKVGDVIQQKHSQDFWEVYEVEDMITGDTYIDFTAKVRKLSGTTLPHAERGGASVTVHGHVFGGMQVNSPHSSQSVNITVSAIQNDISALKKLLEDPRINNLDREDATHALDRVTELSKREKSPEIVKRAKEKLDLVKVTFDVAKDIALLAMPYIDNIARLMT